MIKLPRSRPYRGGTKAGFDDKQTRLNSYLKTSTTHINFGDIETGNTSPPQMVTITNSGEQILEIGTIEIAGVNANEFAVLSGSDNCSGNTLTESQTCNFEIVFMPQVTGARSARVEIGRMILMG